MPYRTRYTISTPMLSPRTFRRVAFVLGAFVMWVWLYFCTNGGSL